MRKIIIVSLLMLLITVFGIFGYQKLIHRGVNKWSSEEIIDKITLSNPTLVVDNSPIISISQLSMPEKGWYVATIKSAHADKATVPVKVLLTDKDKPGHDLRLVLGPDVFDPTFQTSNATIPASVIVELKK